MKILVTGSNGLVGKSLQKIVNSINENEDVISSGGIQHEYYFLTRKDCNLIDVNEVNSTFEKINPDIVVHLASMVGGVYENINNNYNMFINNIRINTNIVDACNKYNVKKLINILSTCVFPDQNVTYPLTADQIHNGPPHSSNNGYAFSKRALHFGASLLKNTTVINLIPTNLYGEHDNYEINKAHVIPALIHKTLLAKTNNTTLQINGTGNALRQFLYVDDLSKIICSHINSDNKSCDFMVSPPESHEISIKELVNKIVNIFNFKGEIQYDTKASDGQIKKTTVSDIDYSFTDINTGLINTIHFFKTNYNNLRI
jgi:GDP-L-fucose synthase